MAIAQPNGEPQRIDMLERVADPVGKSIQAPAYPYGVGLYVPPDRRVVVATIVVAKIGLLVEIRFTLPRESKR